MLKRYTFLSLCAILLAAMAPISNSEISPQTLIYEWQEGTIPPPDYYEYTIRLNKDGTGEIRFRPDYPNFDPPEWVEKFEFETELWMTVVNNINANNLAKDKWSEPEERAVGGSLASLEIITGDKTYSIPSHAKNKDAVSTLYRQIKAALPEGLLTELRTQHQEYGLKNENE